mmetsp:Transcript_6283/g.15473  ORF Transcript_6283/g.15473 Transcript_6283/m.15473 type:complete len:211 (-) Transcript_6283:192-824(-)
MYFFFFLSHLFVCVLCLCISSELSATRLRMLESRLPLAPISLSLIFILYASFAPAGADSMKKSPFLSPPSSSSSSTSSLFLFLERAFSALLSAASPAATSAGVGIVGLKIPVDVRSLKVDALMPTPGTTLAAEGRKERRVSKNDSRAASACTSTSPTDVTFPPSSSADTPTVCKRGCISVLPCALAVPLWPHFFTFLMDSGVGSSRVRLY